MANGSSNKLSIVALVVGIAGLVVGIVAWFSASGMVEDLREEMVHEVMQVQGAAAINAQTLESLEGHEIARLQERLAFLEAVVEGTPAALERFLDQWPDGDMAAEAQYRINNWEG